MTKRRTVREWITHVEVEGMFPVWLLLAVLGAFTAEVLIIGRGITEVYGLAVIGYAVGFTIASVQAMGATIGSYNATHNAHRRVVHKMVGPKDNKKQVEDTVKSEPKFGAIWPYVLSLVAGVAAAMVALALYAKIRADANELMTWLDVIIAVGSPIGSISVAVLNGLFVSNEAEQAKWKADYERAKSKSRTAPVRTKPEKVPVKPARGQVKAEIVALWTEDKTRSAADIDRLLDEPKTGYTRRIVRGLVADHNGSTPKDE